jgi:hypothetical protein
MFSRAFVLAMLMSTSGACYGPDREAGDDPDRADEGPTAGRPRSNPYDTVDKPGAGGGRTTDADTNEDAPTPDPQPNDDTTR